MFKKVSRVTVIYPFIISLTALLGTGLRGEKSSLLDRTIYSRIKIIRLDPHVWSKRKATLELVDL